MTSAASFADFLESRYAHLLARCREAHVPFYDDAGVAEQLQRVLLASDFAYDCFSRDPALLAPQALMLMSDPRPADARVWQLDPGERDEARQMMLLRRFRKREALRLIWRDVNGLDEVADTLAGSTALAETCIESALRYAEANLGARHGLPRDSQGRAQRLVVLGLGKLGGGELNFSSDVDLILAYAENGQTDGTRVVDNEAFFARLGQQMVKLLAEVSVDGYVYRVDLRLRPFGNAGRVALSFAAMEQYYQREGRNWERYAWIKARPVAGDLAAGKRLCETLRPFVYRRYLDYTAFAGLREMKALIDAEVARKDLTDNLKLGPGGIREIEFIVQLLQMIRGGREPSLRVRGLLPALAACEQLGVLEKARAQTLRRAYLFLRRAENRVQMLRDEQTHDLPADARLVERIACGLGHADTAAFERALAREREAVAEEFRNLLAPVDSGAAPSTPDSWIQLWRSLDRDGGEARELAAAGFLPAEPVREALLGLTRSPAVRSMANSSRERFDRLMPQLLQAAAQSRAPAACLERLVRLLHAIVRRVATLDAVTPDPEAEIELLQELKHSLGFRLGLAFLGKRADAVATSRRLAVLAETIVATVLAQAERDALRQHGRLPGHIGNGSGLAIVGYGSLGAAELGFASDLDLVFLYDEALGQVESDGPKPLDGQRYYARIAQRVVHLLTTMTRAGRLYEVDVRLRPDGGKGLLVTSVQGFADYQRERAWTWEHQALVRSRLLAGDDALARRFAQARAAVLGLPREREAVFSHVATMRARWRAERDRSDAAVLDLKQGAGALLDIEFLLQALVLAHAAQVPALLGASDSSKLIALAAQHGLLGAEQAAKLARAHATLLDAALTCTLDARPRIAPRTEALSAAAADVLAVVREVGMAFG